MDNTGGLLAALLVGGVAIGAAQGQPAPAPSGDVVVGTHFSRSPEEGERHYAECGPDANAEPAYEVELPADDPDMEYRLTEGDPCPDGPRRQTARDKYPELYDEMLRGQQEPLEFAGGDSTKPCGTWETSMPEAARQLSAECPPLTRGDLPR